MLDPLFWKGKRVFVTGSTGFKGTWLSLWLQSLGAEVFGFALPPPTTPSLFVLTGLEKTQNLTVGDVRDRNSLSSAMAKASPEVVFHLAAQPLVRESYSDPVGTYSTNVMGTVHLFDVVRECPTVRAVVNVTTDKCYENQEWFWGYRENEPMGGHDPYSNSKGCSELVTSAYRQSFFSAEQYGKTHQVAIASARAGNVIGGGDFAKDRLIPDIIKAIQNKEKVKIRSPRAIRPWQHVLEPLSGYLLLAQTLHERGTAFAEAWNFGPRDEDSRPVEWIVKNLTDQMPGNMGYEIDLAPQPHEAKLLKLDISKAINRLGWAPRWSLEKALRAIVEWTVAEENKKHQVCLDQIAEYQAETQ